MDDNTTLRIPASFRLNAELLNKLKERAKASNRSLNNFVESVLMNAVADSPNDETLQAMNEARTGKELKSVDTSSLDTFIKSCSEE